MKISNKELLWFIGLLKSTNEHSDTFAVMYDLTPTEVNAFLLRIEAMITWKPKVEKHTKLLNQISRLIKEYENAV